MSKSRRDHGGTEENFLRQFPLALQPDSGLMAIARVLAGALEARWDEAALGILYPRIDELSETILDILAYDFKVDWWDRTYSIEEKRRTLKDSWQVHRMMGTKAAVETALGAVFHSVRVEEWFEYAGGEPYHFRILVQVEETEIFDREKHKQVISRVAYYKNLRSWMDVVRYQMPPAILENKPGSFLFQWLRLPLRAENRTELRERMWLTLLFREEIRPPEAALRFLLRIDREDGKAVGESAVFRSLGVRLRARSYGWDVILLDGERRLDGGWLLGQRFRGMAWEHVRFRAPIQERERISGGALYGAGAAKTEGRTGAAFQAKSGIKEESGTGRVRFNRFGAAFREKNRLTGTVERDTTWRLDGVYQLNGKRILHEGILKEEI